MSRTDFHRLYLRHSSERGQSPFVIHLSPSRAYVEKLAPERSSVHCASADEFRKCLSRLGASAISEWVGEERDHTPQFNALPATVDQIWVALVSRLAGQNAFLTALVFGTPVIEMEGRVSAWLERGAA